MHVRIEDYLFPRLARSKRLWIILNRSAKDFGSDSELLPLRIPHQDVVAEFETFSKPGPMGNKPLTKPKHVWSPIASVAAPPGYCLVQPAPRLAPKRYHDSGCRVEDSWSPADFRRRIPLLMVSSIARLVLPTTLSPTGDAASARIAVKQPRGQSFR